MHDKNRYEEEQILCKSTGVFCEDFEQQKKTHANNSSNRKNKAGKTGRFKDKKSKNLKHPVQIDPLMVRNSIRIQIFARDRHVPNNVLSGL